jgi:hypothetical protein
MKIYNKALLLIPLFALLLPVAHAASYDDRDDRYGDRSNSGPAAPSTIPGQGDSKARVPMVKPVPATEVKPRKPKPQASPWGGTTQSNSIPPPVTSQPASPPVAQPNGTPQSSGPKVVVTPGQSTPPPSQPQSGANDQLLTSYRGLSTSSAAIRGASAGTATRAGSAIDASQRTTATALVCSQNGNTPKITRLQPANESTLEPGAALIAQGLCFGAARGKVLVTLPTQYGRIQAHDLQILDWTSDKILAQLPADIVKALPGAALVEVAAADGLRSAGKEATFEPRWQLSLLPVLAARVRECRGEGAKNKCIAGEDTESDNGFMMPKNSRCMGIGTCYSSMPENRSNSNALNLSGLHYTEDDIRSVLRGRDQFEVTLQSWMKPSHCDIEVTAFSTDGRQDASATARFDANAVVVDWSMSKVGDPGWLSYSANCKVWVPAGLGVQ